MPASPPPNDPKSTDITWHGGTVSRDDRATLLGQRGCTLWLTGLSGSGKSTVAVALEKTLRERGRLAYRLDGDNVRHGLNANLGFSAEDRTENIRRIAEVARLFADAGVITLASFISPYRAGRDHARALHEDAGLAFFEVHVACPLEEAEKRDPKGLYRKARAGEIQGFTGIDAPFEAPEHPERCLDTSSQSIEQSVAVLLELLESRGILHAAEI